MMESADERHGFHRFDAFATLSGDFSRTSKTGIFFTLVTLVTSVWLFFTQSMKYLDGHGEASYVSLSPNDLSEVMENAMHELNPSILEDKNDGSGPRHSPRGWDPQLGVVLPAPTVQSQQIMQEKDTAKTKLKKELAINRTLSGSARTLSGSSATQMEKAFEGNDLNETGGSKTSNESVKSKCKIKEQLKAEISAESHKPTSKEPWQPKIRAGSVVLRVKENEIEKTRIVEVLLISSRTKKDVVTLPSGKHEVDKDSTLDHCAMRETIEEAGVRCEVMRDLGWYKSNSNLNAWTRIFIMNCIEELAQYDEKNERSRMWVPLEDAVKLLSDCGRTQYAQAVQDCLRLQHRAIDRLLTRPVLRASSCPPPEADVADHIRKPLQPRDRKQRPAAGRVLLDSVKELGELAGRKLAFYRHQVGGHTCLVKPAQSHTVFKPRERNESFFYNHLEKRWPQLQKFVPRFYGNIHVQHDPTSPYEASNPNGAKPSFWKERWSAHDIRQYIVLEDLAFGMEMPCILDLKMGCKPRSARYTEDRRQHKAKKLENTTTPRYGFRLCGLQTLNPQSKRLEFWDKYWSRKIQPDQMFDAIALFFSLHPKGSLPKPFSPYSKAATTSGIIPRLKSQIGFEKPPPPPDALSRSKSEPKKKLPHPLLEGSVPAPLPLSKTIGVPVDQSTASVEKEISAVTIGESYSCDSGDADSHCPRVKTLLMYFIKELEELRDTIYATPKLRFWSGSLLFVFDGAHLLRGGSKKVKESAKMRMIDFANATEFEGSETPDMESVRVVIF